MVICIGSYKSNCHTTTTVPFISGFSFLLNEIQSSPLYKKSVILKNMGGIYDNHCLNFLFIINNSIKKQSVSKINFMLHFFLQLCEGLLGLSTVYIQKENMIEAKKLMTRALELATYVLGVKHQRHWQT
jgi:hypothetical protein